MARAVLIIVHGDEERSEEGRRRIQRPSKENPISILLDLVST